MLRPALVQRLGAAVPRQSTRVGKSCALLAAG